MVEAERSPTTTGGRLGQPPASPRPVPSDVLIGRDAELAELTSAWHGARAGRGRVVHVTGDAGMGKTHLLHEAARRCADRGATVIETTCPPGAPPLWPWIDIAGAVRRRLPGGGPPVDGERVPEWPPDAAVAVDASGADAPPVVPGGEIRYRNHDAFVRLVERATVDVPLLVVVDDLHWADSASVELVGHLAPRLRSLPILLLTAGRGDDGAGPAVAALTAEQAATWLRIHLTGLGGDQLALLVGRLTGHDAPPERFVTAVERHTGGNPYFVREVFRLVVAEGRLESTVAGGSALPVPDTVQAVLVRRVAGLSQACRDALAMAAVAGPDADLGVVAEALGRTPGDVASVLDEAVAARLVDGPPTYRTAHDLVRGAVYDSMEPALRRRHHAEVAAAIEARGTGGDPGTDADLARHWTASLPDGDAERAARYSVRAAAHASSVFAHAEAVRRYRDALTAMDLVEVGRGVERLPVQLALGDALQRSGDASAAADAFTAALDVARRAGDTGALAHAALGLAGPLEMGHPRPGVTAALEEALHRCGDEPGAAQARVRARLGLALLFTEEVDRRRRLVDEAVAMARTADDVDALATALFAWHVVGWTPDNVAERIAAAQDLAALGGTAGRRELALWGTFRLLRDRAELGDVAAVDREITAEDRLAAELNLPVARWLVLMHRSMRAMVDGRLAEAEQLAIEAVVTGEPVVGELAPLCLGGAGVPVRMWQGRLAELEGGFRAEVERHPDLPSARCSLALILAETDEHDEARARLDRLATDGFARVGQNNAAVAGYVQLAQVAARVGADDHAARLYEHLAPLQGRCAVGALAEYSFGAVDLHLGMLATLGGHVALAARHFEAGLAINRRIGARPALAQTQVEYGAALAAVDPVRAAEMLGEAVGACDELGMPTWGERAASVLETLTSRSRGSGDTPGVSRFHRDGHVWRVSYAGEDALVDDSKGMRDLAQLLAHPGRDIHVLELSATTERRVPGTGRRDDGELHRSGRPDELLDATAREAYRNRIVDLEADLAEAEDMGDPERAARARAERDLLVDELAAALGLGGRARRHRDDDERARQAVTARIRYACNKLAAVNRPLAEHLAHSVRTGRFCSYAPETPVDWKF